jgi:hypothetical protein
MALSHKNTKLNTETTENVSSVIEKEKAYLNLDENASGFAISGGGIRSASFGLGVMQALVANDQLKKIDYMSTVSGGGYLGSALTWALHTDGTAGTDKSNFPLGKKGEFARQDEHNENREVHHQNNGLLDFIRQHSSYLMPTGSLGVFSFAGVVLRGILLSLLVYCSILVVVAIAFRQFDLFQRMELADAINKFLPGPFLEGIFIPLSIFLIGIYLISSLLYSLSTFFDGESGIRKQYLLFIYGQIVIGYLWKISLLCLLIGLVPVISEKCETYAISSAGGSTLYGILIGIWQYVKAQKKDNSSGMLSDILIYLAAIGLIYGLMILAYNWSGLFFENAEKNDNLNWMSFIFFIAVTFVFGFFVNLNLIGPHRIWRDRLMEAFMPDKNAVEENKWKPATHADSALMEKMCNENNPRPYHIINTNIILGKSKQVKFNGRGGDNFIISPFYCGSEATGWRTTETFQKKNGRGITLATAMATSAAALNPDAGVSGAGLTRNTMISTILSLLNLRLGYWTGNPRKDVFAMPPNFFIPGIKAEILRNGFKETDSKILLSDGGHFENLAIYELIRRKLKLIILSDGGADAGFNFDDLANAVEKVRVDFGAKIMFRRKDEQNQTEDFGPNGMLFDSSRSNEFEKKYQIAERGFAIADIIYNDGSKGILLYLKLVMVHELTTDVYSYKGINPTFPHQSTADQFFDEKQFEAYRELGYTVTWKMMDSVAGKKILSNF